MAAEKPEPAEAVGAGFADDLVVERIKPGASRAQIAPALAVDNCWPHTIAARPAKPGSRCRSAGMPVSSKIGFESHVLPDQCVDGIFEVGLAVEVDGHSRIFLVMAGHGNLPCADCE